MQHGAGPVFTNVDGPKASEPTLRSSQSAPRLTGGGFRDRERSNRPPRKVGNAFAILPPTIDHEGKHPLGAGTMQKHSDQKEQEFWYRTGPGEIASDEQLMMEVREGNVHAFDELVERHYDRLVFFLTQMLGGDTETARDLAQETFLRVFRARARYEPRAPWLAWVRKIARNLVYDEQRRRRHGVVCSLEEPQLPGGEQERLSLVDTLADSHTPQVDELLCDLESLDQMRRTVATLSPKHAQVLQMRLYEEMNYQEIASALGCSLGTVKSRIHYAVKELQQRIGERR